MQQEIIIINNINSSSSSTKPIANGIPQGSPLSAVLLIIAFDEVIKILSDCKYIEHCLYADDIFIFTKQNNINVIKNCFNILINKDCVALFAFEGLQSISDSAVN